MTDAKPATIVVAYVNLLPVPPSAALLASKDCIVKEAVK